MAGSLKTTFFNLAKYAANDITSWLADFNGNMDKIDGAMNENKTAAQTAQDGVDNLESEYESLLSVVNGHTTSIDANEKAIAANEAAIENLRDDFAGIDISTIIYLENGNPAVSLTEPLCKTVSICGRNIGGLYSGSVCLGYTAGTLHSYDRNANVPAISNAYITDIVRITGNPFGLKPNSWTQLLGLIGNGSSGGTNITTKTNKYVIGYIESSNFTVIGLAANSAAVSTTATTDVLLTI